MNSRRKKQLTTDFRIAHIQSCWHQELLNGGRIAFTEEMQKLGLPKQQIDYFDVPGAFEIPLHAKLLAKSGRYAAIVASALVVDGGIYRHEFVADVVVQGLMQVQLETEVPVLSAVLTPHRFHEHDTHQEFFSRHLRVKGAEAAIACVAVLNGIEKLKHLQR